MFLAFIITITTVIQGKEFRESLQHLYVLNQQAEICTYQQLEQDLEGVTTCLLKQVCGMSRRLSRLFLFLVVAGKHFTTSVVYDYYLLALGTLQSTESEGEWIANCR